MRISDWSSDVCSSDLTSSKATPDPVCVAIRARAGDFTPCEPIMPKYQELFAPAYALDVLLPVISLGSKADWKARLTGDNHEPLYWGWALQFFTWALAFVGWVSGLMLVVVLGGLAKKDRSEEDTSELQTLMR